MDDVGTTPNQRHKVYKPLIVRRAGERCEVLGGNMRLIALREIGAKRVEISIVAPKTEAEALQYALSDNDRIGKYDQAALARLLTDQGKGITLEDYRITVGDDLAIEDVMRRFGPAVEVKQKELDENIPTTYHCKECGYRW